MYNQAFHKERFGAMAESTASPALRGSVVSLLTFLTSVIMARVWAMTSQITVESVDDETDQLCAGDQGHNVDFGRR
jgi:hypothetical protein